MLLVAINLQSTICTSADLLFHHTISMTMMDNDDVKIVSDVLDDVQPKEREKKREWEKEREEKKRKKVSISKLLLRSNLQGLYYPVYYRINLTLSR